VQSVKKLTDVSDEHVSIFKVDDQAKQETGVKVAREDLL
jgi:hypothetical protein